MKLVETVSIREGIDKVIDGINKTVDPVKNTMGAKGKTVCIHEGNSNRITKDGVSVAGAIILKDPEENVGCELVKSAAKKTVSSVGDGTTGTSVLLQALVNKSKKHLEDSGVINEIIKGMDIAYEDIINNLTFESKKVDSLEEVEYIASIASNSKVLGELIATCYSKVGLKALVLLEKSSYAQNTYYEIANGIDFSSGWLHPSFANSPGKKCIFEKPIIILEDQEIRRLEDAHIDVFNMSLKKNQPIVIIAPSFSKDFITTCLTNRQQKNLQICLIKSPGFGDNILENYQDISAMSSKEGIVDKIVIDQEKFVIYKNTEDNSLQERLKELAEYKDNVDDEYEFEKTINRIHSLQGSTAVIYTGGNLLEDQGEEFDRLEDALGSVKAAIKGGYVVGGGLALLNAAKKAKRELTGALAIGYQIVKESCQQPIKQILENANLPVNVILEGVHETNGYNVLTNEFEDFTKSGIIDPLLVIKESLTNALTTCKLLINTKYIIVNGQER